MEKVYTIKSKDDKSTDLAYWLSKTPQERLDAIEVLRQNYFAILKAKNPDAEYRLQRVCKIIERKRS